MPFVPVCKPYQVDPADSISKVLSQAWLQVCPPCPGRPTAASQHQPQPNPTQGLARQLWSLRALKARSPDSFSILRGWLLAAKLSRVQRLLPKACRLQKRLRLEAILSEAESSRYSHAIFSAIKRLAPKSRFQRVQFRDSHGCLMSPQRKQTLRLIFEGSVVVHIF